MPIYEYSCEKCSHEFEREQRITEDPIRKCPACGADRARRLISRTSFVLKGGGWYNDLYSSAKPKKDGDGAKGDDKPAKEKSEKKEKAAAKEKTASSDSGKSDAKGSKSGSGPKAAA